MIYFIRHILHPFINRPCALIMDGYQAHWTDEVKAVAAELSIELITMPANHTDEIQPLDVGVFGALQKMTDSDWSTEDSVEDYLHSFQVSWGNFKEENVRKSFYQALALEEGILENEEMNQQVIEEAEEENDAIEAVNELNRQENRRGNRRR